MRPGRSSSRSRCSRSTRFGGGQRKEPSGHTVGALLIGWFFVSTGCAVAPTQPSTCAADARGADAAGFRLEVCQDVVADGRAWRRIQDLRTGKWIEFSEAPTRVVSQTLATDEILADLLDENERPRLLAVSAFSASPRYSDLGGFADAVGTTVTNKTEEILALRPDLVFAASYSTAETVQQLEGAGVPTVVLHRFDSVDAIRDNVRVVAFTLGLDGAGRRLESEFDEKIARAAARVRQAVGDERPRVLAYGSGSAHAQGTLMDDLFARFGFRNPASEAGLRAWPTINEEHLIDWRPDVIFLSAPADRDERVRAIFGSRFAQLTSSVQPPDLLTVPETLWSTVSQRVGDLALHLAAEYLQLSGAPRPLLTVD